MNKSHWKTKERPPESYPRYYYSSYGQDIRRFKQKVELSRSECIECNGGVYEIPKGFTHVDVSYDSDYDREIALSLYFIKYAPDEEIPNYEERLTAHQGKQIVAKEKADKVFSDWQKWSQQQIESEEYQKYLSLREKYGSK